MRSTPIITSLLVLSLIATPASAQGTAATPATTRPAAPAALPADSFDLERKYTQWFYTQRVDSLCARPLDHELEGRAHGAGTRAEVRCAANRPRAVASAHDSQQGAPDAPFKPEESRGS